MVYQEFRFRRYQHERRRHLALARPNSILNRRGQPIKLLDPNRIRGGKLRAGNSLRSLLGDGGNAEQKQDDQFAHEILDGKNVRW